MRAGWYKGSHNFEKYLPPPGTAISRIKGGRYVSRRAWCCLCQCMPFHTVNSREHREAHDNRVMASLSNSMATSGAMPSKSNRPAARSMISKLRYLAAASVSRDSAVALSSGVVKEGRALCTDGPPRWPSCNEWKTEV